jgi:hypothetical protein
VDWFGGLYRIVYKHGKGGVTMDFFADQIIAVMMISSNDDDFNLA